MKPISRTHCQVDDTTYRLYPMGAPMWYKKPDGTFDDIDLTFNDTTSTIGDISLMDKNIFSVGKRKGNNPHKVVGIRPDKNQHLGTQQLEFSLINVELDGESQDFNVETDLEISLRKTKLKQLVKLNRSFNDCKIEFDIYAKGLSLQNSKYTETTVIRDFGFNLTNIGENNGNTNLGMHNTYNRLNKDISYFDCYAGKITDDYITTGGYSKEEEFGDNDLSDYVINENLYPNGGSMYLKDCIIFTAQAYNISNIENIMTHNICDLYGLEVFNDGGTGKYFTKDNKKVGGYGATNEVFFAFINTTDIPDKVKTLFQNKDFEETSFLNLELSDFCTDISNRFNKDLKIEVDDTYYKPINNQFEFKISNESFYITPPVAFDKNYNILEYYTTHTLKENSDGSYRYTKILKPDTALDFNSAQYLDANLAVSGDENYTRMAFNGALGDQTFLGKTSALFDVGRNSSNGQDGSGVTTALSSNRANAIAPACGNSKNYVPSSKFIAASSQWVWGQTHYKFDSSSVSGTVSSMSFKARGAASTIVPSGESSLWSDISIIFLKSDFAFTSETLHSWNQFVGHTSDWSSSDVTEYSAEIVVSDITTDPNTNTDLNTWNLNTITSIDIDPLGSNTSIANFTWSFNSDARSDISSDSTFKFAIIEYDEYYSDNYQNYFEYAINADSKQFERGLYLGTVDNDVAAQIPYIEYTTSSGTPSVTYNATFFGTNF